MRTFISVFAIAVTFSPAPAIAQQDSAKQIYEIRPCLREFALKRTTAEGIALSNPQVQVVENCEAVFDVGKKVLIGEKEIRSGTVLRVKIRPMSDKTVQACGVLEVSKTDHPENDADIVTRESCEVHFNKTMKLGQPMRVRLSKTPEKERWFELSILAGPSSSGGQATDDSAVGDRVARNVVRQTAVKR